MPPVAGYTFLNLGSARAILSGRLQDPFSNSYWTVPEVNQAINEAVQAWQAYTASYRQRVTFNTATNTPFYDLPSFVSPASAMSYSVTDRTLVDSILAFLLEPPLTAVWTGTGQFTFAEIMAAIQSRVNRFLGDTDCVITRITPPFGFPPPIDRTFLPENVLDVRRGAWSSNSPGSGGTLWGIHAAANNTVISQVSYSTSAGANVAGFVTPHIIHDASNLEGRGCAVDPVNQIVYYSYEVVGSFSGPYSGIWTTNFSGVDLGLLVDMHTLVPAVFPQFSGGIQDLVFDNGTLWVTPLTSTTTGYQISIATKGLLQTVPNLGGNFKDGLYVNSAKGIAILNQGDGLGPYDLYTLSGGSITLTTAAFLDPVTALFINHINWNGIFTGLTFDGTYYIMSSPLTYNGGSTQLLIFFDVNGKFVSAVTLPAPGPQVLPGNVLGWNMENIAFATAPVTPVSGPTTPMFRDDDFATQAFYLTGINFPVNPPQVFTMFNLPPVGLRVFPPPSQPGGLDLLILQAGVTVGTTPAAVFNTPVVLQIPDDLAWGIKFGALADLLSGDGPSRDPERAAYCEQRYTEAVAIARLNPSVLLTEVNNALIWTGNSIFEMDAFQNSWQSTTGTPTTAGMGGRNMLAFAPVADGVYPVAMDVAGNIPQVVLDSDFLQVDRGNIDPVLNYAQHLLCFKMAGAEFQSTIALYRNFIEAVKLENSRLRNLATYGEPMTGTDRKQEGSMTRVTLPTR